jgi:hypothetical protein
MTNPFKVNGVPALFDKVNGFLIVLPDNAELTSEIGSGDIARAKKIINLREGETDE